MNGRYSKNNDDNDVHNCNDSNCTDQKSEMVVPRHDPNMSSNMLALAENIARYHIDSNCGYLPTNASSVSHPSQPGVQQNCFGPDVSLYSNGTTKPNIDMDFSYDMLDSLYHPSDWAFVYNSLNNTERTTTSSPKQINLFPSNLQLDSDFNATSQHSNISFSSSSTLITSNKRKDRKKRDKDDFRWNKRFKWSQESHFDFTAAVFEVGLNLCTPSDIQEKFVEKEIAVSYLNRYKYYCSNHRRVQEDDSLPWVISKHTDGFTLHLRDQKVCLNEGDQNEISAQR